VTVISSSANRYVRLYRSLDKRKARKDQGLLPLEGSRLVTEAVGSGLGLKVVLLHEGYDPGNFAVLEKLEQKVPVQRVAAGLFAQIAHTDSPQGILAVAQHPAHCLQDVFLQSPSLLLVADRLQDPGNLGTMVRSAAACGASGAVLLPGTVDISNPKALRATMGALFRLPVVEVALDELLAGIRRHGLRLMASCAGGDLTYDRVDWRVPTAVVIGNEGAGVSEDVLSVVDSTVSVPMAGGVESLNAAIAMSVIFFEAARQRRSQR